MKKISKLLTSLTIIAVLSLLVMPTSKVEAAFDSGYSVNNLIDQINADSEITSEEFKKYCKEYNKLHRYDLTSNCCSSCSGLTGTEKTTCKSNCQKNPTKNYKGEDVYQNVPNRVYYLNYKGNGNVCTINLSTTSTISCDALQNMSQIVTEKINTNMNTTPSNPTTPTNNNDSQTAIDFSDTPTPSGGVSTPSGAANVGSGGKIYNTTGQGVDSMTGNQSLILDIYDNNSSLCSNESIALGVSVVGKVLDIIKIVVPIILVLIAIVDITKSIVAQDDSKMDKTKSLLVKRLLSAVIIFFILSIIQLICNIVGKGSTDTSCMDIIANPWTITVNSENNK